MPPVVILGCGPAGLFAAQAIKELGGDPLIHSKKQKSEIYGPQFLTKPIPGLTNPNPDGIVKSTRYGTKKRYAERVYGETASPSTWANAMFWDEEAWDLRKAYDRAWDKFEAGIVDIELAHDDIDELTAYFPLVISTIPHWRICKGDHIFSSIPILIKHDILPGFKGTDSEQDDNYVIYNGTAMHGWFRTSSIFGMRATETTIADRDHPMWQTGAESGYKIVGNDCDCHPNLIRAGRMGTWRRGVQTIDAYQTAIEAFTEQLAV